MTEKLISLPALYLREVANVVGDYGVDSSGWLDALGIALPEDGEQPVELPLRDLRRVVVEGKALTDPASFGLQVGQRLLVNSHGMLGYAAMNSASLRQVTELIEQFLLLRTNLFTLTHEIAGAEFRVVIHEVGDLGEARLWVLETIVLAVKNIYDFIAMGDCPVRYATFAIDAPRNAQRIQSFLKSEVRFNASWTGFALPLSDIDRPLKMANASGFAEATRLCLRELDEKHGSSKLSDRIRRMLLNSVGNFPSLETTASNLNLTPRTMHRRLLSEGTSFKELQEETRHMLALRYLQAREMSVQEIAYMLGYSDVANFRRAFKRWEGVAPKTYRENIAG
ncbi:AraC family transcriptional regulator [Biformimicrobium ophioploci]|uniref:Ornithine utilization transcriptional regulator OruR n=1 Tax=Biformimicrobium ophioploci TaxID=3036711 RepID=A0ABQ6M0C1_9GAMM|nr:AraC family transcriptional regulator [Microbulbifer sp. NKW57]GMG87791.1 ornithine utilization transcriptional regulator OruR [Microbulbifer sp. NKW57]